MLERMGAETENVDEELRTGERRGSSRLKHDGDSPAGFCLHTHRRKPYAIRAGLAVWRPARDAPQGPTPFCRDAHRVRRGDDTRSRFGGVRDG